MNPTERLTVCSGPMPQSNGSDTQGHPITRAQKLFGEEDLACQTALCHFRFFSSAHTASNSALLFRSSPEAIMLRANA